MAKNRKIAVVTGSRADYGLLGRIIKILRDDARVELQVIVTGAHLDRKFGMTAMEIGRDARIVKTNVKIPLFSDGPAGVGIAIGSGVIGFTKAFMRLKPDVIVLLGDRFEIFAAAASAVPLRIPVAHIHGGESTEGAFDEQFRHAITKMSHFHFASTAEYRKRIIAMGEDPGRVFCTGAPGLDDILRGGRLKASDIRERLALPERQMVGIVTYHPATLEGGESRKDAAELIAALGSFTDIYWVITSANADSGGRAINRLMKKFAKEHPKAAGFYESLGRSVYIALSAIASVMVGNSSSGIIEAPSFRLPVVNIGSRQQGRIRAGNVIDVPECRRGRIEDGIRKALSPAFRVSLRDLRNPYGNGRASEKIAGKLMTLSLRPEVLKKRFYEK